MKMGVCMSDLFFQNGGEALVSQVLSILDAENRAFVLLAPDLRIAGLTGAAKSLLGQDVLSPLPQVLGPAAAAALELCFRTGVGTELADEIDGIPYRIEVRPADGNLLLYFEPADRTQYGGALRAYVTERTDAALATILLATRKLGTAQPPEIADALAAAIRTCSLRIHRTLLHAQELAEPQGAVQADLQAGDLALLCRTVAKQAASLRRPGLAVLLEAPVDCPAVFDARLLTQALYNLLANAMAAAGVHEITLRLSHTGSSLSLSVLDDGAGLPPASLARLYDGWHSTQLAEQLLADAAAGTRWGLGLPLVRRIAGLHSGVLLMRPNEPRGTVFTLTFPDSLPPLRPLGQPPLEVEDGFDLAEVEFSTLAYTI